MFTIVIPCYEDVQLLDNVLAGFVCQKTKVNFEIILVDNNTTDEDIDFIYKSYLNRLQIYLIRRPKLDHPMAPCSARNIGLYLAKYPWIINIDADCIPNRNYIQNLFSFVTQAGDNNYIIAGIRVFVDMKNITAKEIMSPGFSLEHLPKTNSPSNYNLFEDRRIPDLYNIGVSDHPWALIHSCNLCYARDLAVKIGGYFEGFDGCWGYEDTDFAYRMIKEAQARPVYVEGIECYHQDSPRSKNINRHDKKNNRNWHLIKARIPGIEEYKTKKYNTIKNCGIIL
jgi:glycosyltransferase involved in cell wall biosynthesis